MVNDIKRFFFSFRIATLEMVYKTDLVRFSTLKTFECGLSATIWVAQGLHLNYIKLCWILWNFFFKSN